MQSPTPELSPCPISWFHCHGFRTQGISCRFPRRPDTRNAQAAAQFVRFLLSTEAQGILKETGQSPLVPALPKGAVPGALD